MRLRLSAGVRRRVWRLRGQQSQAFNLGVELGLGAVSGGLRVPSAVDGYKTLTERRGDGSMPKCASRLQRAGVRAGLDAVTKWQKAVWKHGKDVEYWQSRVEAALSEGDGLGYAQRRLSAVTQRRDRHRQRGTRRLFRSRKRFEREPSNGAALVFDEHVRVKDGVLVLPGGTRLKLADQGWQPADGWELRGSAQIVDVTPRVTRRTRAQHRKYEARLQLRQPQVLLPLPESREQVDGVDPGAVIPVMVSDGRAFGLPEEAPISAQIKGLKRRRARCTHKSRKWKKLTRRIRVLEARRANRRTDGSRHIAKRVASTEGVRAVASEAKNARQLTRSAKGTKQHPGVNVAQKRGLNRKLSRARFGGIRSDIERACQLRGIRYVPVAAGGSSTTCHRCGSKGTRETQAVFQCSDCGYVGNADYNSANVIGDRGWACLTGTSWRSGRPPSDGRWKGNPANTPQVLPETIPNKPLVDSCQLSTQRYKPHPS